MHGKINTLDELCIMLTATELDTLEQQRFLYGKITRENETPETTAEDERKAAAKKGYGRGSRPATLAPNESVLALHVRDAFRFEGMPSHEKSAHKKSYDIVITPSHVTQFRAQGKLEFVYFTVPLPKVGLYLDGQSQSL